MELKRYLNGVEIDKKELYSKNVMTNELLSAVNEARYRAMQGYKSGENKKRNIKNEK